MVNNENWTNKNNKSQLSIIFIPFMFQSFSCLSVMGINFVKQHLILIVDIIVIIMLYLIQFWEEDILFTIISVNNHKLSLQFQPWWIYIQLFCLNHLVNHFRLHELLFLQVLTLKWAGKTHFCSVLLYISPLAHSNVASPPAP